MFVLIIISVTYETRHLNSPSGVPHGFVQGPRFCCNLETQFIFSVILYEMFLVQRTTVCVYTCVHVHLCSLRPYWSSNSSHRLWVQSLRWIWFSIIKLVCENIKYNVNGSSYECERYYVSLHDWVSYLCLLLQRSRLFKATNCDKQGKVSENNDKIIANGTKGRKSPLL